MPKLVITNERECCSIHKFAKNFDPSRQANCLFFVVISQLAGCLPILLTTATEVGDSLVAAGFALAILGLLGQGRGYQSQQR